MKFQDSSFNSLKVTVSTKSVTHPRTHAPKAICPINFFKVGGIIRVLIQSLRRTCCYGNTGVVDAGQISVIFMQRTVT